MTHEEKLKKIDDFFENLSLEEFEKMSIKAGLGVIGESPSIELYDKTIDVIKERKNHSLEEFTTGYVIKNMTTKVLNEILSDPQSGIVICKSEIPMHILNFFELLRIAVYHNVSDEDVKSIMPKFSLREGDQNEPTGSIPSLSETVGNK